jgi:hypothetical protein
MRSKIEMYVITLALFAMITIVFSLSFLLSPQILNTISSNQVFFIVALGIFLLMLIFVLANMARLIRRLF